MFLVKDSSTAREERIRAFLEDDPALAALLAVVHVEWTLRRAIIGLSRAPNVEVRERLTRCHGHAQYRDAWRDEVLPRTGRRLTEVVADWNGLVRAFRLRHVLVHGVRPVSAAHAAERTAWALAAAGDVRAFCARYGVDLDARLPVRRRKS